MSLSNITGGLVPTRRTEAKQIILGRQIGGERTGLLRRKWGGRPGEGRHMWIVLMRSKVKMARTDIHPVPWRGICGSRKDTSGEICDAVGAIVRYPYSDLKANGQ
jgi:hypothetical protein